jgi:peptidoglycan/xylan/chitin deacetylase (PgdA/CDA1 family)
MYLFFLFFFTLLHAEVDYIDYEDTYDSEAYYNLPSEGTSDKTVQPELLDEKIQSLEEEIRQMESEAWMPETVQRKTIYLTFDDGPLQGTGNVLEILEEEQVPATFFFVGKHIQQEKRLFDKVRHSQWALVANHTYTHANGHYRRFYRDVSGVLSDVEKTQSLIGGGRYQRLAGRNVWRLSSYVCDDHALQKYVQQRESECYDAVASAGYMIFGWDLEWEFARGSGRPLWSAAQMYRRIVSCYRNKHTVKEGKVVLLVHDFMFRGSLWRGEVLQELIGLLKADGWKFDTVDHYVDSYTFR